jgi:hypothetical protein
LGTSTGFRRDEYNPSVATISQETVTDASLHTARQRQFSSTVKEK